MNNLAGARVAILVQNLPVPFDRRVWQEALALKAAGADVTVVSPADERYPKGTFDIDGIHVRRYAAPPEANGLLAYLVEYGWALIAMTLTLARLQPRKRFQVIHFCNPPDLLFLVALPYKLLFGTKLIFDQHDLGPELMQAKKLAAQKVMVGFARFIERLTYRAADHVISTNESYKRKALERGGFAPDDVTVVRSGPRQEWIKPAEPTSQWHRGHKYLIGYVGVMGRQEGIEYLIDAAKSLLANGLDVQVALVGGGPDAERLKEYSRLAGTEDNVSFLGRLSDEDLRSVLTNADVCVNPDEVNDLNNLSTMNKIVEYMALGRPIVQFDVVEGRYSAGESSLYAAANDAQSFADKIEQVLLDPVLAREMGERGRTRFRDELCWEMQTPALTAAYLRVLDRPLAPVRPLQVPQQPERAADAG